MKKVLIIRLLLCAALCVALTGCGDEKQDVTSSHEVSLTTEENETTKIVEEENENKQTEEPSVQEIEVTDTEVENTEAMETEQVEKLLCADGRTLETRILPPDGYMRTEAKEDELIEFLRNYPVKTDGSPVYLYDGSEKGNQSAHVAVFELPIENRDLQQCADSVMRVYAEYYWNTRQYERIKFHFTNGFLADYISWRDGFRIFVDGNDVTWKKTADYDDSYENFVSYLHMVFSYAGTLSMEQESEQIDVSELQAGDIILKGGSPGHVVMIVDVCENVQGEKAFLFAQGYMPAQEFHVLKNPLHEENPWYYESEMDETIVTPEYVFAEGSIRRLIL